MIASFVGLALLAAQATPPDSAWTWTLYTDEARVALANEVPDTPSLRFTLECDPASGVARVAFYGGAAETGMARVTAGEAVAVTESTAERGALKLTLRTDHPVFAAFAADGRMAAAVGEHRRAVEVPRPHLAKLRRFTELCSG
ncbi:hypothetical protein N0B44_32400 [Roseibacterium beibuensis]|uniref:hypothetical protein n=1 Tax=[Roseibacterium] beibuensis TaxID=1193142 RepID=UPI00217E40C4|nr:hypothetical protein [Roseibacterium beibuensis]MCS6627615.1 hypothetical protein [Roseibacterium beibuensis]